MNQRGHHSSMSRRDLMCEEQRILSLLKEPAVQMRSIMRLLDAPQRISLPELRSPIAYRQTIYRPEHFNQQIIALPQLRSPISRRPTVIRPEHLPVVSSTISITPPLMSPQPMISLPEETLSKEELLSIIKKLAKEMECAICLKVLNPPLCLCQNGHYICESCNRNLHVCPTCRAKFLNVKTTPKIITNFLDILPKECKYSDCGCTYLNVSNAMKDHEMICPFKNIC